MLCRIYLVSSLSVARPRTGGTTLEVRVSDRKRSSLLMRLAVPAAVLAAAGIAALSALPSSALAAPTTPPSTVYCGGTIRRTLAAPRPATQTRSTTSSAARRRSPVRPTRRATRWNFTGNIWSYTILVTRRNDDGNNVTYEAPTANVLTSSGAVDAHPVRQLLELRPERRLRLHRSRPGSVEHVGSGQRHESRRTSSTSRRARPSPVDSR